MIAYCVGQLPQSLNGVVGLGPGGAASDRRGLDPQECTALGIAIAGRSAPRSAVMAASQSELVAGRPVADRKDCLGNRAAAGGDSGPWDWPGHVAEQYHGQ